MLKNIILKCTLVVGFCVVSSSVLAEKNSELLKKGINAFKSKEYDKALLLFESELESGNRSQVLLYNLGVVRYELGMYRQAVSAFKSLEKTKLSDVSYFNQGLCWEALGNQKLAKEFYTKAEKSDNKKLKKLAREKLDPSVISTTVSKQDLKEKYAFGGFAYFAFAEDDNVNKVDSDLPTQEEDSYLQSYINATLKTPSALELNATYLDLSYSDLDIYDYQSVKVGAAYLLEFDAWEFVPSIDFFDSEFGGRNYQSGIDYSLKSKTRLYSTPFTITYKFSDISSDEIDFSGIEGNRHRIRFDFVPRIGKGALRMRYQFENNDRKNTATRSYSPTRHLFSLKYRYKWNQSWSTSADVSYRMSDYSAVAGVTREDTRKKLTLNATYRLNGNVSFNAKYQQTIGDSNLINEDYDRNVVSAGAILRW